MHVVVVVVVVGISQFLLTAMKLLWHWSHTWAGQNRWRAVQSIRLPVPV
jgi:hypothetical protein